MENETCGDLIGRTICHFSENGTCACRGSAAESSDCNGTYEEMVFVCGKTNNGGKNT